MAHNLKLVTDDDPDEIELRRALHVAIEARDAANVIFAKASDTNERAVQFISRLENALDEFGDVDGRVARERANAFRVALEHNSSPVLETSAELRELSARKLDLGNQLAAARLAQETLTKELNDANQTLDRAQGAVEVAALKVAGHIADTLARDLGAREADCATLRRRLLGATTLRPRNQIPLNQRTLALLRDDSASGLVSRNDVTGAAWWNDLVSRLMNDSGATIE
jgi:hypothetical protein